LNFIGQIDKVAVGKSKGIVNASRLIDKAGKGISEDSRWQGSQVFHHGPSNQRAQVHGFRDLSSTFSLHRLLLCFACIKICEIVRFLFWRESNSWLKKWLAEHKNYGT